MKRIQAVIFMVLFMAMTFSAPLYAQDGPAGTGKTMSATVIANDLRSSDGGESGNSCPQCRGELTQGDEASAESGEEDDE